MNPNEIEKPIEISNPDDLKKYGEEMQSEFSDGRGE